MVRPGNPPEPCLIGFTLPVRGLEIKKERLISIIHEVRHRVLQESDASFVPAVLPSHDGETIKLNLHVCWYRAQAFILARRISTAFPTESVFMLFLDSLGGVVETQAFHGGHSVFKDLI